MSPFISLQKRNPTFPTWGSFSPTGAGKIILNYFQKRLDKGIKILYISSAMRKEMREKTITKTCGACGTSNSLTIRGWKEGIEFEVPQDCRCGISLWWDEEDMLLAQADSEGTKPLRDN